MHVARGRGSVLLLMTTQYLTYFRFCGLPGNLSYLATAIALVRHNHRAGITHCSGTS